MMKDNYGRTIDYLRVSVTDRCNLKCAYCVPAAMPSAGMPAGDGAPLADSEIVRLVRCFAGLGVSRIRLTGGEPLLRPGICGLVREIAGISGISDVALSTNGIMLAEHAADLKRAGLNRVNVSLDTLDPGRFTGITGYSGLESVLAGIEAALAQGLNPVKINCVVARGLNDQDISSFVALTEGRPVHVRFIELMPVGPNGFFSRDRWVPLEEMMEKARPFDSLPRDEWPAGAGPARYFRRPGSQGTVGFIGALSSRFCRECNRVRLTSDGVLLSCLDAKTGTDLRTLLRGGTEDEEIGKAIAGVIANKPEGHYMLSRISVPAGDTGRVMCQIGG